MEGNPGTAFHVHFREEALFSKMDVPDGIGIGVRAHDPVGGSAAWLSLSFARRFESGSGEAKPRGRAVGARHGLTASSVVYESTVVFLATE